MGNKMKRKEKGFLQQQVAGDNCTTKNQHVLQLLTVINNF
jgi:hypothetical protein